MLLSSRMRSQALALSVNPACERALQACGCYIPLMINQTGFLTLQWNAFHFLEPLDLLRCI